MCTAEIIIIQGDTYQKNVAVNGVMRDQIQAVYFSCAKLNVTKELPFDPTIMKYVLRFTPEETASFKHIVTDFDITVKLAETVVKTGVYRGKLMILEKNNSVEGL